MQSVLFVYPALYVGVNSKYLGEKGPSVFLGIGLCYHMVGVHPDMCNLLAVGLLCYQCLGFDDFTSVMPASPIHGLVSELEG